MSQVIFFSCLDYGAKWLEVVNKHEPGYAEPRVESVRASGDVVCPRAGAGSAVFLLDVICSSASAGGQLYNRTTNTAVIVSVIPASWFKALLCRPVVRHAFPPSSLLQKTLDSDITL